MTYEALLAAGARAFPLPAGKKAPPPKGWQEDSSRFIEHVRTWQQRGLNIGLAVGGRLFVVDIDLVGMVRLDEIEATPGWSDETYAVATPHGFHLYWLTPEGHPVPAQGSSKTLLGEGIDTRVAKPDGTPDGFVVGPGSIVDCDKKPEVCDGRHPTDYRVVDGYTEPQVAPVALLGLLEKPGQRALGDAPPPSAQGSALDRLQEMLTYIDPDDRDTWRDVGFAVQAEFGDAGRPLWEEWSRRSAKWDERDGAKNWKSFGRGSGVTYGTLVALAREGGYVTPTRRREAEQRETRAKRPVRRPERGPGYDAGAERPSGAALEAIQQNVVEPVLSGSAGGYEAGLVCAYCEGPRDPDNAGWFLGIMVCAGCLPVLVAREREEMMA